MQFLHTCHMHIHGIMCMLQQKSRFTRPGYIFPVLSSLGEPLPTAASGYCSWLTKNCPIFLMVSRVVQFEIFFCSAQLYRVWPFSSDLTTRRPVCKIYKNFLVYASFWLNSRDLCVWKSQAMSSFRHTQASSTCTNNENTYCPHSGVLMWTLTEAHKL